MKDRFSLSGIFAALASLLALVAIILAFSVYLSNGGTQGEEGERGETGAPGATGLQGIPGAVGAAGPNGNGIEGIEKTASNGLIDTYTITLTDGTTTTFEVKNADGIFEGIDGTNGVDGKSAYKIFADLYPSWESVYSFNEHDWIVAVATGELEYFFTEGFIFSPLINVSAPSPAETITESYAVAYHGWLANPSEITIPSTYKGLPVTAIAEYGFAVPPYDLEVIDGVDFVQLIQKAEKGGDGAQFLQKVNIPSSIVEIGQYAFFNNKSLKAVEFEGDSNLEIIYGGAFGSTGLESIELPASVYTLGNYVFSGCTNLETVDFSGTHILYLGQESFKDCTSLISVSLPLYLTGIGEQAFTNCVSLTTINIPVDVVIIYDLAFSNTYSLTGVYMTQSLKDSLYFQTDGDLSILFSESNITDWSDIEIID